MQVIEARVDQSRVVEIMRRAGQLPLVKEYLLGVQKNNLSSVNEAINELLVEEEDWNALRDSITTYDNCLLYTSPSPRDISGSRMPSSA